MEKLKNWARRNPDLATLALAVPLAALTGWYFVSLAIHLGGL